MADFLDLKLGLAMQPMFLYLSGEDTVENIRSPLCDNPYSVEPGEVGDIKVEMTIVGGKVVYEI